MNNKQITANMPGLTKFLVVLIILFFTFFRETTAQKVSEAPIIQNKITIDGNSNDWPNTLLQIPKSGYQYFAGIQEQRLLIGITFDDPILQEQILMSGFTLWINEKGKKKEVLGIRYPLGLPEDQIPTDPGLLRDRRQQLADDPQTLINSFQHLELINFYGEGETTWGESVNPEGIQAKVDTEDNGKLIYEISLPLDIIFKDPEKLKSPKAKGFVLGFISGNLERPAIRGDMSVGISGGSLSNPSRPEGTWERNMQKLLEEYREFTISREAWTQKYSLPRE
ncbi:MAG: hypothetical protein KDD99_14230 [Bacteroidetes bacterium]|nr:hypothetical protein [Bacteroidota bacterium]